MLRLRTSCLQQMIHDRCNWQRLRRLREKCDRVDEPTKRDQAAQEGGAHQNRQDTYRWLESGEDRFLQQVRIQASWLFTAGGPPQQEEEAI